MLSPEHASQLREDSAVDASAIALWGADSIDASELGEGF